MSLGDRFTTLVTERSALVVVVMLVLSGVMGAGMAFVDDEAGLNQFQFESEESEAQEYIEANFEASDEETTAVQIVLRSDDNVLSKESLIKTIELQQDIRNDEDINQTLANERPTGDLASVVATAAIQQERAANLTQRREQLNETADQLEARSQELNETADQLEARSQELNATAEDLEARGRELNATADELEARGQELNATAADLEARSQELNQTAADLESALNETAKLAAEYGQLNVSLQAGQISQAEYDRRAATIESQLDSVFQEATADLDEEQTATFADAMSNLREIQSGLVELEAAREAGQISESEYEQQRSTLQSQREDVYRLGTQGVLADAFEQLKQDQEALESKFEQLKQDRADLEARADQLQQDRQALEADFEQLREDSDQLEADFEQLREDSDQLEADFQQLRTEFEQLRALDPTLDEQRDQLESMDEDEIEAVVEQVLGEDAPREALAFVPTDFDRGTTQTDARQLFVIQMTEQEVAQGEAPPELEAAQLEIADHVDERFGDDAFVFGAGIISDEINRSMADSMAIVLPLALVFVVIVLSIAYRDPLDILLGMFGIALVLIWTFGFMGWTGISFNQIMIAVPVLLVGLSIDYAIHLFMRHREERMDGTAETRRAMASVLIGLGAALVWLTVTAVIGFLSNLVSPVAPIQEFGIVSAFGITSTLVIFGTIIPAMKVGLDAFLESRGWDRRKRAFGTGGGAFTRLLSGGYTLARQAPLVVLLGTLLITAAGAYGATQVDTTFAQEDFIADDPPDWMESLPAGLEPGEYTVKQNLDFVNDRFIRQDSNTQVLIEGDITSDSTLEDIDRATETADEQGIVVTLSGGEPDIRSPLSVMERVAAQNATFNATYSAADTDGDGIPDQNLAGVYDAFFETAPEQASDVIYRENGDYEAARMVLTIQGGQNSGTVTEGTREVANTLDTDQRPAIATGQLVVFSIVEDELFNTVIESMIVTIIAVFLFLMVVYRIVHDSAILGAVTLTPIVLTVAWILGTMYLLGISFNVLTGTITSLTIGLGVAYNIHMSERYLLELNRGRDVWESMRRAVTGTGGALLGSAATTTGGFGVLALAILPPLQQFGIITGITIVYAFFASVFILPSFLVLWTRYLGPADQFPDDDAGPDDDQPGATTEMTDDGPVPREPTNGTPGSSLTEFDPEQTTGAGQASQTPPSGPSRQVDPPLLESDWSYTVTVTVPLAAGRTMLSEQTPTRPSGIQSVDPAPVDTVTTDDGIHVRWAVETPTVATVTYTADPPAIDAGELSFDGAVVTAGGEQQIAGRTTLSVVADALAAFDGDVDDQALQVADRKLEQGDISHEQYRQVAHAWLGQNGASTTTQNGSEAVEQRSDETAESDTR